MKVLVTGATGFVGSRIVSELKDAGIEAIAVHGPRSRDAADHSVDVTDRQSVEHLKTVGQVDAVIHTAALAHRFAEVSDEDYHRINVQGVENMANLAAALGAKHFVLFSSTLVYGRRNTNEAVTEDMDCHPTDAYGQSKLDGESIARTICEENEIDLTILRPSPIIGEGSKGNFHRLIKAIDRRRFAMVGTGENRKSLIYVGDVAKAVVKLIAKGGRGTQIFNLAGGEVRMIDIVSNIHKFLGKRPFSVPIPGRPLKALVDLVSKIALRDRLHRLSATLGTWLANDVYSTERIEAACGFAPETTIADAIKLETEFYLKHK